MTFSAVLALVAQYGPTIVPLLAKLTATIQSGRGAETVGAADWLELERLATLDSAAIYARLGITPPPIDAPKA